MDKEREMEYISVQVKRLMAEPGDVIVVKFKNPTMYRHFVEMEQEQREMITDQWKGVLPEGCKILVLPDYIDMFKLPGLKVKET